MPFTFVGLPYIHLPTSNSALFISSCVDDVAPPPEDYFIISMENVMGCHGCHGDHGILWDTMGCMRYIWSITKSDRLSTFLAPLPAP